MSFIPESLSNDTNINNLITVLTNCKVDINIDTAKKLNIPYKESDIKSYIDPKNPKATPMEKDKYISIITCSIDTVTSPEIYMAWSELGFLNGEIFLESVIKNKYMELVNTNTRKR